jgi:tRNA nucleotidyltransferase (CCA-adding enzyme)
MLSVDYAAKTFNDPEVTFGVVMHDLGKKASYDESQNALQHEKKGLPLINTFCDQWKVPNSYRVLALLVCEFHTKVHGVFGRGNQNWTKPKSIMSLFEATGALRNPLRFEKILKCCVSDARGRGDNYVKIFQFETRPYPQYEYLMECLLAVQKLDTKEISSRLLTEGKKGTIIGEAIRVAQINQIRSIHNEWKIKSN